MPSRPRKIMPLLGAVVLGLGLVVAGVLAVGGYFESRAYVLLRPEGATPGKRPQLAAVFWSGDMGLRVGVGEGLIEELRRNGVPVLAVSTPVLFGAERDRAYADAAVTRSIRLALQRTGAERVVVIGNSFGADVLGAGLGRVPEDLRGRIAQVVLMVPGTEVYFHANPLGIFYRGPVAADPVHTIPLLRGLAVTCVYGADEDASLCRSPVMATARHLAIADGHMMLWSRAELYQAVLAAIATPPSPMH